MEKNNLSEPPRRKFLKQLGILTVATFLPTKKLRAFVKAIEKFSNYTKFTRTNEKFKNGEYVWNVENNGQRVGEFWPIHGINLVTRKTNPEVFRGSTSDIIDKLGGVATAPDGMTTGSFGNRQMEGKALANGVECGDGKIYNYGIVLVHNGFNIKFTHKQEILDFDKFYNETKNHEDTLFFLPSIYRNGKYLDSQKKLDKVLVRREVPKSKQTPNGEQIGVIIFDNMVTYNDARTVVLGLNRSNKSKTTHIYMLDGGDTWGQAAKEVNGKKVIIGKRDPKEFTNYLVFY